jgi:hypothetical protein
MRIDRKSTSDNRVLQYNVPRQKKKLIIHNRVISDSQARLSSPGSTGNHIILAFPQPILEDQFREKLQRQFKRQIPHMSCMMGTNLP